MLATNEAAHPPRMSLSMESMLAAQPWSSRLSVVVGLLAPGDRKRRQQHAHNLLRGAACHASQEPCAVARTTNGIAADDDDAALTAALATQGASSSEPADREH